MKLKRKRFKRSKPKLTKKVPVFVEGLERYVDGADEQKWVRFKIIVPREYDKEQLLKAFEYIHDIRTLDTDYIAVNTVAHIYCEPNIIIVDEST